METSAANLFPEDTPSAPLAFNPFGASPMQSDLMAEPFNLDLTSSTLNNEPINQTPAAQEEQIETFDMFGDIITKQDVEEQQAVEEATKKNIGDQINRVRDAIKDVEGEGFQVELEEYDFEDVYQMTVKIKKQP